MSTEVKIVDNIYMHEDNEIQEVMDSMKAYWFTEEELIFKDIEEYEKVSTK